MARILLIEDEDIQRKNLSEFLISRKYKMHTAGTFEEAINLIENNYYDIILSDMKLKNRRGEEVLDHVIGMQSETVFIFITAYASLEESVDMIKKGAFDYISKPVILSELQEKIKKALQFRQVKNENIRLKKQIGADSGIIYQSEKMKKIIEESIKYAHTNAPVLLCGESGTGKELLARLIHNSSERSEHSFTAVNCGALNENLLESELFGHEKGAFTGADRKKAGRFEIADSGTIFLDEIGEISQAMQVKLLRVIQEGEFERVGGTRTIKTDVRIIAATNRNLKEMIGEKLFREDLFFRLNVLNVHISPLRERKEDIKLLTAHYIERYAHENGKKVNRISQKGLDKLMSYSFPGNVRELQNIIQRAVILSSGSELNDNDIIIHNMEQSTNIESSLNSAVEMLEKNLIEKALNANNFSIKKASEQLQISERQIRYKMKKLNIL